MSEPYDIPPQPLTPSETRNWAIAAHLGTFVAAWIAMGVLCPLVVWLMYRDRSEFCAGTRWSR
jgi:uncharacterized Tic20 family protein